MRILAIETSLAAASVAALDSGELVRELALDPNRRSVQSLAPGLQQLLNQVGWKPADVEQVAVAIGPGSFTSLRLGVMTAKAYAFAVGATVIGIETLTAIAARAGEVEREIAVAIDAQRGEVYCRRFAAATSTQLQPRPISPLDIVPIESWLAELTPGTLAAGPALSKVVDRLPPGVTAAPREHWLPTAATIGQLAADRASRGEHDDLWTLAPLYVRRSAAEEKAAAE